AKPVARFIGRGARDAARRQRLAELAVEIEEAESAVRRHEAARDSVRSQQRTLEAELAGAPTDQPLRDAHAEVAQADRELQERSGRVDAQQRAVAGAARAARAAEEVRDEAAADLALPIDQPALEDVREAVARYQIAAAALWPDGRRHLDRLGM